MSGSYYPRHSAGTSYYYGRRNNTMDIIGEVVNNDTSYTDLEKDFCQNCGIRLEYFNKIRKKVCPRCTYPLTAQEREELFSDSLPKAEATTTEEPMIDDAGIISPKDGLTPMKREGDSDIITRQERAQSGGGVTIAIPSRRERNRNEFPSMPGDEHDATTRAMERQGAYLTHKEVKIPSSYSGDVNSYDVNELKYMNARGRRLDSIASRRKSAGLKV